MAQLQIITEIDLTTHNTLYFLYVHKKIIYIKRHDNDDIPTVTILYIILWFYNNDDTSNFHVRPLIYKNSKPCSDDIASTDRQYFLAQTPRLLVGNNPAHTWCWLLAIARCKYTFRVLYSHGPSVIYTGQKWFDPFVSSRASCVIAHIAIINATLTYGVKGFETGDFLPSSTPVRTRNVW